MKRQFSIITGGSAVLNQAVVEQFKQLGYTTMLSCGNPSVSWFHTYNDVQVCAWVDPEIESPHKLLSLEEFFAMKPRETVEVLGQTYYKDDFEDAIGHLKTASKGLKSFKIRIPKNEQLSRAVIDKLMTLGYIDHGYGVKNLTRRNIYTNTDGQICWNLYEPDTQETFNSFTEQLTITLDDLFSMEKREIITLEDGRAFYKSELQDSLKAIKPL